MKKTKGLTLILTIIIALLFPLATTPLSVHCSDEKARMGENVNPLYRHCTSYESKDSPPQVYKLQWGFPLPIIRDGNDCGTSCFQDIIDFDDDFLALNYLLDAFLVFLVVNLAIFPFFRRRK